MSTALTKQNENQGLTKTDDSALSPSWASAPVDILEGSDEFLVYADVPGVKKDDVKIEYASGELRLHARREETHWEAWPAQYRRAFTVGREIDVERITAELEDGVLRVHLPKLDSAKPRQISILGA